MKSNKFKLLIIGIISSIIVLNIIACKPSTKEESVSSNTAEESNLEDDKENIEETTPLDGMKRTELKNVGKLSMYKPTADSRTLVEAVSNEENIK